MQKLLIRSDVISKYNIHLHVPEAATQKMGQRRNSNSNFYISLSNPKENKESFSNDEKLL
jgi:hypothetical protein